MRASGVALLLALASAIALVDVAQAHCGGLHDWYFTPAPSPGKDFLRHRVAKCSSWSAVSSTAMLGALPYFPDAQPALNVSGFAEIWWYFDANCTERLTTAVTMDAYLTLNGQPYGGKQVMGYGFTGNCANPGDIYRHDYARGDNRCNLIWWRTENSNTTEDGHLVGGAPNVFRSRVPPAVDAVRSVVLYPSPADSAPMCCDLEYEAPPADEWWTWARACVSPPPSPAPSPAPLPSPRSPSPRRRPSPRKAGMVIVTPDHKTPKKN